MLNDIKTLRFYFITDDSAPALSPAEQVRIALGAGATCVQYRNKHYAPDCLAEVVLIRQLCRDRDVPFVVNDNIGLARQVMADGVHLGQDDAPPARARELLGDSAIVGISVSDLDELARTDLAPCDYMGTGAVFPTGTKPDAATIDGLAGLEAVVKRSPLPVVAIGGITARNATACFEHGASGVAVISFISRAEDPLTNARQLAAVCQKAGRG
ncbi:thiamine phosphate synthase [Desulfonema ishimotonii]|uniref:Thiamine-phosphate synthase n=1 Tax=Desulfonema ishimotonii TaxID=45657 RepID=A0A401G1I1_9BACT|nr:thiamine phosphate synthase [Desulfonema ishimotonii]GBC63066.1 thiamine phosphate synthase [Desulfonema ishimotonii]